MSSLARNQGFESTQLLTEAATGDAIVTCIREAAKVLANGDFMLISYSGHGGQLPDTNSDEPDKMDETWCLFDYEVRDDHLYSLFSEFRNGVRLLVISDSCHSGSVWRMRDLKSRRTPRGMPTSIADATYRRNSNFYDQTNLLPARVRRNTVNPSIISLSACADNQLALDGAINGEFTGILLDIWNEGKFSGDYNTFHQEILQRMPTTQSPVLSDSGVGLEGFLSERPFTIEAFQPVSCMEETRMSPSDPRKRGSARQQTTSYIHPDKRSGGMTRARSTGRTEQERNAPEIELRVKRGAFRNQRPASMKKMPFRIQPVPVRSSDLRRRLVCGAAMEIVDDETFGRNETAFVQHTDDRILEPNTPTQILSLEQACGGEVLVVVNVVGTAMNDGGVEVEIDSLLYEGTNEAPDDLDVFLRKDAYLEHR
jgi:hypothetical protein